MPLLQQSGLVFEPRLAPRPEMKTLLRPDLVRPFRQTVQDAIESAMILCGGNKSLAAKSLKVNRTTFQAMWNKYVRDGGD
jgi:transcriptional regulator with PAS, ATPase and Fis domain